MLTSLESGFLDSIAGLPVHPLVVHFAVVLLPLAALGLVVLVAVPTWADRFGWLTVATIAAGTAAAFAAKASGEALSSHMGAPAAHVAYGDLLPPLAVGLFVLSVAWFLLHRRTRAAGLPRSLASTVAGDLAAVLALVVTVLTVLVGHSGAQAAWGDAVVDPALPTVTSTAAPTVGSTARPTVSTAPKAAPSSKATAAPATSTPAKAGYTMADVAKHAAASSCWSVVNGNVYDLTAFVSQHPGGPRRILSMCGTDATAAFAAQHAGQSKPGSVLKTFLLGPVG